MPTPSTAHLKAARKRRKGSTMRQSSGPALQTPGNGPALPCTRTLKQAGGAFTVAAQRLGRGGRGKIQAVNEETRGSGTFDRTPVVGAQAVKYAQYTRFNPLQGLSPELLSRMLDSFELGYLSTPTVLFQRMIRRDNVLSGAVPARTKDVTRRDWSIVTVDKSREAKRQAAVLDEFWRSVTTVDAFDRNDRGKIGHVMGHILSAHAYRYAASHFVWQPRGGKVSMELELLPLNYFLNTSGELRDTLPDGLSVEGNAIDLTNWHVCKGEGLMEACSVAYVLKHLPLSDLLGFSQKVGVPFIWVEAPVGCVPKSDEWEELTAATGGVMADNAAVFSNGVKVNSLTLPASGDLPFMDLVKYADMAMNRLWRGHDMNGMSREDDAAGASTSASASLNMVADDCRYVTDQLQRIEDRVAEYHGFDGRLASIQVRGPVISDVTKDLEVDKALIGWGAKLGLSQLMAHYERPEALPDEEIAVQAPAAGGPPAPAPAPGFNESEASQAAAAFAAAHPMQNVRSAQAADLAPLYREIGAVVDGTAETIDWPPLLDELMQGNHLEDAFAWSTTLEAMQALGMSVNESTATLLEAIHRSQKAPQVKPRKAAKKSKP